MLIPIIGYLVCDILSIKCTKEQAGGSVIIKLGAFFPAFDVWDLVIGFLQWFDFRYSTLLWEFTLPDTMGRFHDVHPL